VKRWVLILSSVVLSACQRTPGEVVDKVLTDFGVREKPEGYETASDHVFNRLSAVGSAELKRMNQEGRHGEVKFQDEGGLSGKYYKEIKVYEAFHPLEATSVSRTTQNERGFVGYIEYDYRIYQSPRTTNRTEAHVGGKNPGEGGHVEVRVRQFAEDAHSGERSAVRFLPRQDHGFAEDIALEEVEAQIHEPLQFVDKVVFVGVKRPVCINDAPYLLNDPRFFLDSTMSIDLVCILPEVISLASTSLGFYDQFLSFLLRQVETSAQKLYDSTAFLRRELVVRARNLEKDYAGRETDPFRIGLGPGLLNRRSQKVSQTSEHHAQSPLL